MKPSTLTFKISTNEPVFSDYSKDWANKLLTIFAKQHNFHVKKHKNGSVTIEAKLVLQVPESKEEAEQHVNRK